MGTGTTGAACPQYPCFFFGSEIDEQLCGDATARIFEAYGGMIEFKFVILFL